MKFQLAAALALKSTVASLSPFRTNLPNQGTGNAVSKRLELSQFHPKPFNLTSMCVECNKGPQGSSAFDCLIRFHWRDDNANESGACAESWVWDGVTTAIGAGNNHSAVYIICGDQADGGFFQFKFLDFLSLSNFSLSLTHMFRDTEDFSTPTMANLFALANVTLQPKGQSNGSLSYFADQPVLATFTGMTI
ncbi:hypothetical protein GGS23DRAFT_595291 [Durotheca rogersii]|uniref:uncharacterized protein n=1 Tax=Durotheca rogersii TaxID=419775 RepID=UPI00221ED55C|nr:uncharacterized protein GGS23DRAFT_595291 [Durotheca rogersii]KAI5864570.1 hypothetical protein GGS23DRAFT_595291 [Durotheca rogersii]